MTAPPLNYIETHRATVTAGQCDHLGHMNMQFYFAVLNEGGNAMISRMGLSPHLIKQRRIAFAVVRMETDFLQELREGDPIVMDSAVESVTEKSVTLWHRLKTADGGREAMVTKCTLLMLDLDRRKAVAIPPDIRAKTEALIAPGGG